MLTKVYCGRYTCQHCFGEVCGKGTVKITSDGCQSYRCVEGWKVDPYQDYFSPATQVEFMEQQRKRMRLLREDKISKDDVNQES